MTRWSQHLRCPTWRPWAVVALLALASCTEQGLVVERPLIENNDVDIGPYVGTYKGVVPGRGDVYLELWPPHPDEGYHFLSVTVSDGKSWNIGEYAGAVAVQQVAGSSLLVQVALGHDYWLDLISLEDGDILWTPHDLEDSDLRRLREQFGLVNENDRLLDSFGVKEVVIYLAATKGGAEAKRFSRVPEDSIDWQDYQRAREMARDRFRYKTDALMHIATVSGKKVPGVEVIAPVMTMHEYGDPWAAYMLARWHYNGWYLEKDVALARRLAEQAVAMGYRRAENLLGVSAYYGIGRPIDKAEGMILIQNAANAGEARAITNLSLMELEANDAATRPHGIAGLEMAAALGDPRAADRLGMMYFKGEMVAQNDATARRLFELAAEFGFADSAFYLGYMREKGRGGEVDEEGAVTAYRMAADVGSHSAKYNLGLMYLNGRGVDKDAKMAAALFWSGAEAEYQNSMIMYAFLLESGQGVERNEAEAARIYGRCAELDNANCQWRLGMMIFDGRGLPSDPELAKELFEKAIAGGEARAKDALAKVTGLGAAPAPQAPVSSGPASVSNLEDLFGKKGCDNELIVVSSAGPELFARPGLKGAQPLGDFSFSQLRLQDMLPDKNIRVLQIEVQEMRKALERTVLDFVVFTCFDISDKGEVDLGAMFGGLNAWALQLGNFSEAALKDYVVIQ